MWGLVLLLGCAPGCVTKRQAQAQAKASFQRGYQQALEIVTQAHGQYPRIILIGDVMNPAIAYVPGMTLAEAIVAAEYAAGTDPGEILILRQGRAILVTTQKLLSGEDIMLHPGDIVQIGRAQTLAP